MPLSIGLCLEYAIYHSPVAFIRTLLELGANPNPPDGEHAGFPPLIAAISCSRAPASAKATAGQAGRADTGDIIRLLLRHGADKHQRGVNDYTPLHMAVDAGSVEAVEILLAAGADPRIRTRIDRYETPREMAARAGRRDLEQMLRDAELRWN